LPLLAGMVRLRSDGAFKDVQVALLVGARPRGPGMELKDCWRRTARSFAPQGQALGRVG